MVASVTLSSDERLRPLVRAFGLEFARAAAVAEPDAARLAGVFDEAVQFVCTRAYPGDPAGNHDHLRLQRLNSPDVELDAIAAASPAGRKLIEFVLADRARVGGRQVVSPRTGE
jgi:hypothetical protein